MIVELYTSAFCAPCHAARATLAEAARLVPAAELIEYDVASSAERAERLGIRSTPTVIVRGADGEPVFRAEGAPSLAQALGAFATALG